jgi:hypothetical protein
MGIKHVNSEIRDCKRRIKGCYRADGKQVRFGREDILAHERKRLVILQARLKDLQMPYHCEQCGKGFEMTARQTAVHKQFKIQFPRKRLAILCSEPCWLTHMSKGGGQ